MFAISIDELLDYYVCSHRLTFSKEKELSTFSDIKIYINRHLLNHCFLLSINDQKINITKLDQKLNYIWNDIKNKATYQPTLKEKLLLKSKVKTISTNFSSIESVEHFNIPRIIEYNDVSLIYFYTKYYSNGKAYSLVNIEKNYSMLNENSSIIKLLMNLIYYNLKQDTEVVLFKEYTGELMYKVLLEKEEVYKSYKNITEGIKQKLFYPKAEYMSCIGCEHNKKCSWNINKK